MKAFLSITCLTLALCTFSCNSKDGKADNGDTPEEQSDKRIEAEAKGQKCLEDARKALKEGDFSTARELVSKIRNEYRLAITARNEGILLLDSVNLFEAEYQLKDVNKKIRNVGSDSLDSLQYEFDDLTQKFKFYKRKLEFDQKQR